MKLFEPRRVAAAFAAGLALVAVTAGAAQAAPAKSVASTTAPCPVSGQRVKTSNSPNVYLVGPDYLYLIPDSTVYFNLWDSWSGIYTDDYLWGCFDSYYALHDARLVRTTDGSIYIYDDAYGGYRWIVNMTVFNKYQFALDKVVNQSVPGGPLYPGRVYPDWYW